MIQLLKDSYEKVLCGSALAAVTLGCAWWWQQQGDVRRLRAQPVAGILTGATHEPATLRRPDAKAAVWPKAPGQSHGPGWLYEVFTPPVIYYNTLARSFSVTPPVYQGDLTVSFGLELLAVKPEQFRLQLAGYFGSPGDYLVAFTSPCLADTLFAREGRSIGGLGLTLKSFAVRKILVEPGDARPVCDIAALAVLTDDQTGGEVVLDSRAHKFTGTPLAVLQMLDGGPPREVREGETFSDENSTYRIEHIQLDPPEVVVARTTSGLPQPETRILRPVAAAGGDLAGKTTRQKVFPQRPATGLATSGR